MGLGVTRTVGKLALAAATRHSALLAFEWINEMA
jgi:hypothetical protein